MVEGHGETLRLVELSSSAADVVLYDTVTTEQGQRRVARLLADGRVGKVVVYTWNFQPWLAGDLIRQGASGYLSKALPGHELVAALRAVHHGRVIVAPDRRTTHDGSAWVGQDKGLTAREAEVLSLIAAGLSNTDVATRMGLSINSVKSYVRSSYRKIDVDIVSKSLKKYGYNAEAIHGDLEQSHRTRTLDAFRDGKLRLLMSKEL